MKILTICERGNSRSVMLAYLLKDGYGHDAIACGIRANTGETMDMLYKWADKIILVDKDFIPEVPQEFHSKMKVWDVGKDRFFMPNNELLTIYQDLINKDPL